MSEFVVVVRTLALLAFAAPMLLLAGRRGRASNKRAGHVRGARAPLLANLAAFGLFFLALLAFAGPREGRTTLLLALAGCSLAVAGAAVVLWSRVKLGPAWSLVPLADAATGLVTTGPYRLVRHPIYLGLSMLALGAALAFASWPALLVLLAGIVPTCMWRAAAEEKLLIDTFGERYALYRKQTRMIIPHLL
jgi:protein-S-isoprenylcysteine O-methyltransferase Ste14